LVLKSFEFFTLALVYLRLNGEFVSEKGAGIPSNGTETSISINTNIQLEPGDVLEVVANQVNPDGDVIFIERGTIKITPTFIYSTTGRQAVPNWTKQEFVSNIFRIFNVLPSYDATTATLTLNLFEKLKDKTPID